MHLSSQIEVNRLPHQVWDFFEDLSNLARWDRSVEQVVSMTPGPGRVGSRFDTIAPRRRFSRRPGIRMKYVVTEATRGQMHRSELLDSPTFKDAAWVMRLTSSARGTLVSCDAIFTLRHRYAFLAPVLWLNRGAILRDLQYMKATIEKTYPVE